MPTQAEHRPDYTHYGNIRPPLDNLLRLIPYIQSKESTPFYSVLMGDIHLDIAVSDPTNSAEHFHQAAQELATVKAVSNKIFRNGKSADKAKIANVSVMAEIRKAELNNWQRACLGEQPVDDYEELLEAANRAMRVLPTHNAQAESKLVEFIPVLLGARARYHGSSKSWTGRTALIREDQGSMPSNLANPNWDTGLSELVDGEAYVTPHVRWDIKQNVLFHSRERQKSLRGGVTIIIARQLGFADPGAIIKGCVEEMGDRPRATRGINIVPKTPQELNEISRNIARRAFFTTLPTRSTEDRQLAQAA